ncbi:ImmA/IrrE family metallo-endopeptidase [Bradyrhizobium sp. USDA 336]|uniref:ImmA/IrrE family metallo-endopeptidase n=1 Tax=Bradyrhizobium sp. USDA 336 TaxID=3156311 RepID=UPI003835D0A3
MVSYELSRVAGAERAIIDPFLSDAPVRLSALASALGLRVISAQLPSGISGEIRPDPQTPAGFSIRVNKNDPARRQRFTVAHEIGHYLLHRDEIGDGITDDVLYRSSLSDSREAQANRLAADLLMPDRLLAFWKDRAAKLGEEDVVSFLADKFNVSAAAMKIRLGIE